MFIVWVLLRILVDFCDNFGVMFVVVLFFCLILVGVVIVLVGFMSLFVVVFIGFDVVGVDVV